MAMIKLEHVNKYFGDLHVLKDINLEVAEGEKLVNYWSFRFWQIHHSTLHELSGGTLQRQSLFGR